MITPSWSVGTPVVRVDGAGRARRTGGIVRPVGAGAAQERDRQHDGRDEGEPGRDAAGPAPADLPGAAAYVVEGERRAPPPVGLLPQGAAEVVLGAHRSSSRSPIVWSSATRSRRVASARLVWDFTVPTAMPSTSAVSASVSSS